MMLLPWRTFAAGYERLVQECLLYGAIPIIDRGLNGRYSADFPVPSSYRVPEADVDALAVAVEAAVLQYPLSLDELHPAWAKWRQRIRLHKASFEASVRAYFQPAVHVIVTACSNLNGGGDADGEDELLAEEGDEEVLGTLTALSIWLAMPGATTGT
jgi:hypothetical protein